MNNDNKFTHAICNNSTPPEKEDVVEEAVALAKLFNEKICSLSTDEKLLFMETFGKNTVLSSKAKEKTIVTLPSKAENVYLQTKFCPNISPLSNIAYSETVKKGSQTIMPMTNSVQNAETSLSKHNNNGAIRKQNKFKKLTPPHESKMELNNQAAADKQRVQINTERVIEWIQKNDNQNGQKTVIIDHNFQNHESVPKKDNKFIQSLSTSLSTTAVKSQVSNVIAHNNEWMQSESNMQKNYQKQNAKKSLNILILGESGVGKSTWINAFANYLIYNTLEEAIAAEAPVCVIPTKFTMNDAKNQCHEVILGEHQNECFKSQAASTTQEAKTYFFETDEYNIYLIDTPGTNDTRGPEQDEENMQKILRAISPFKELHAICFLFKPNEYRLKPSFCYNINSLLNNLSKSSVKNLCIVFTNSLSNFYKPGNTLGLIQTYFKELNKNGNFPVIINDDNVFCLENEAFRFCCAKFGGVKIKNAEIETYSESWTHSAQEISRLLKYAAQLRPNKTSDTLSINETRTWILRLINPTIQVSDIIQTNMQKLEERINELESIESNIEDLQKRAAVPITSLEIKRLNKPQTVCASRKCVQYEKIGGNLQTIYKTVCHKDCFLLNSDPSKIPDPALRYCAAFDKNGKCYECGCIFNEHIRIFYEQKVITNHLETKALKHAVASEQDTSQLKKKMIINLNQMIQGFKKELQFIMETMSKFSLFLSQNGISQKADIFEKYIQNLLENEEKMNKNVQNYDNKKYMRLADILFWYKKTRENILEEYNTKNLTLSDIQDIRQKLFAMPLTGSKIAEIFDIHVEVDKHDYEHNVTICDKESVIKQSKSWYQALKNRFFSYLG